MIANTQFNDLNFEIHVLFMFTVPWLITAFPRFIFHLIITEEGLFYKFFFYFLFYLNLTLSFWIFFMAL